MFSSRERLQQKTPANGIDRKEFINLLVDEYYETTNVGEFLFSDSLLFSLLFGFHGFITFHYLICFIPEAQEQVTANLANFSYDPLNYEYLKDSNAIELFLQLLSSSNPNLTLHGIAGLCNLCLG